MTSFDSDSKSEIVVNTGTLIALARGDVLDLVGRLPLRLSLAGNKEGFVL